MYKKIIENEQLYLREFTSDDFRDLCLILQDEETMYAYESAFTEEKVRDWLNWNLKSYQENGFGLWAIIDQKVKTLSVNAVLFILMLKMNHY
ncbi:GNAT family N-acetyltransferase [Enterococcus crotali]|uniref:GNAT family N-acetyltransferase n=1 Tax=Enterococcus crotali TaxID=1453587 RepID=UPI000AF368F3|nr:GNAT family N-acetyltransferase [Enterococcus crotali]